MHGRVMPVCLTVHLLLAGSIKGFLLLGFIVERGSMKVRVQQP